METTQHDRALRAPPPLAMDFNRNNYFFSAGRTPHLRVYILFFAPDFGVVFRVDSPARKWMTMMAVHLLLGSYRLLRCARL